MRHTINLATRAYVDKRALNISISIAFVLMAIISAVIAGEISSHVREMGRLNRAIALLEGKTRVSSGSRIPEKDFQFLMERIKFANGIIVRKSYDWLLLLERLENVVPDGVAILSIDPSPQKGDLKLAGVARGFASLRKFVESLEESGFFSEVYLVSQAEAKGPDGQPLTGFNVACRVKFK